jgi:hypothetical protein
MGLDARIIHVDGTYGPEEIGDDHLAHFYHLIGCRTVDVVRVVPAGAGRAGLDMWIDDEGLYSAEPNPIASALVRLLWGREDVIQFHGAALFAGVNDGGETVGLTGMQASILDAVVPKLIDKFKAELPA